MTRDKISLNTNHYTLIGMSGAGKSTIGRLLAEKIGCVFFDSDTEIERVTGGMKIPDIFERYGEQEFRRLEKEVLLELVDKNEDSVISTGGGAVMQQEIASVVFSKTTSIWLKISEPVLWQRQKAHIGTRPMLNSDDPRLKLQTLLRAREPTFSKASLIIEGDGLTPIDTVNMICEKLNKESAAC